VFNVPSTLLEIRLSIIHGVASSAFCAVQFRERRFKPNGLDLYGKCNCKKFPLKDAIRIKLKEEPKQKNFI
jgi:hypothetical protein